MKKRIKQSIIFLIFLIISLPLVTAAYIDYDDDWDYNEGTSDDAAVWGGYYLDVGLNSLTSNADAVCWDWDGDGEYSHCYFETGVSEYECDEFGLYSEPSGDPVPLSDLYDTHCSLGGGGCDHEIDTGSSGDNWGSSVDAIYFEDCDGTASYTGVSARDYWVIYGHQYDCDSDGSIIDPDYEGYFDSWLDIDRDSGICSASEECDENHDQDVSYTASATPSDPCRTKNWYSCSSDGQCISDYCYYTDECSSCNEGSQCTSTYWNQCYNFGNLCCSGDPVDDQYYCKSDTTWAECSNGVHTGCEQQGSYYCISDGGDWHWDTCTFGCSSGSCTEPDIDVSPDPLIFNVG